MGISERPWTQSGLSIYRVLVADCEGQSDRDRQGTAEDIAHAVARVNAIHAAGISPEALAADPECVKRLVEALRALTDQEGHFPHGLRLYSWECTGECRDLRAALRACGLDPK